MALSAGVTGVRGVAGLREGVVVGREGVADLREGVVVLREGVATRGVFGEETFDFFAGDSSSPDSSSSITSTSPSGE